MKYILLALFSLVQFSSCSKAVSSNCVDPAKINKEGICTMIYDPVCGCDGKTYGNECEATNAGLTSWQPGECKNGEK